MRTRSLCRVCKRQVDAEIHARDGAVWLEKSCPEHGRQEALLASSEAWWDDCLSFAPRLAPPPARREIAAGCPHDCGPCAAHEQRVHLPVIPITSACNLDCPICYTVNKSDGAHWMSKERFAEILAQLCRDHDELDILNLTGGEPTLHPDLVPMVEMARAAGVRRVTVSTNGLALLDEGLVRRLAAAGARVILSLDTLRPEVDRALLGATTVTAKLAVLDLLERHDVVTTLLPAVGAGYNDDDLPALLELLSSRPHVCSLELHTLTFTGQGGTGFDRRARLTIPDLLRRVELATAGRVGARDFVPSPLADPRCYSICYLLALDGGGHVPFTRLTARETVYDLLSDSLYLEPRDRVEQLFHEIITELWTDPDRLPESDRVLATLKRLLGEMFPPGEPLSLAARQRVAERAFKAIYVHAHMDEETFDVERVRRCPIGVPEADGSNTPTCAYNVVHRERDPRFADPAALARMEASRARLPVLR